MRSPLIFLVSLLLATLLASPTLARQARHKKERHIKPEDLIANDRGIESNRDFTNMVQYGLIDGMFKYKMSGIPDCTNEGMTLWRAIRSLTMKARYSPQSNDQDLLNIV